MAWRLVFIEITFGENKGVNRKLIASDIRLFIFKYTFALVIAYHVSPKLIPVPPKNESLGIRTLSIGIFNPLFADM